MTFHKIDSESSSTITSALNFFNIPPTNATVSSSEVRQILTLNPINDRPFHFKIHANTSYLDLTKFYVFTEMRIRKLSAAGVPGDCLATDDVGVIQNVGSTFIKNIKVSINGREVYDSNSLYAYKTYLDTELSYPKAVKESYLTASGYYSDVGEDINAVATNKGFTSRKKLFKENKRVQFISKLDVDLFNQELYLINNTEIDIEILPNDDAFMILAPAVVPAVTFQLEITQCKLLIKTLELMDGLALDVARKLDTNVARYPVRKSIIKSLFVTEGRTELNANILADQIPRRIIVGLVENDAYVGKQTKSPFVFKPYTVREITIMANGRQYPSVPYDLSWTDRKYTRAYHDLQEILQMANTTDSNGISLDDFNNHHCLFGFSLTNSMEDHPGCYELIKNGTTSIHIKFSDPVPAGGLVLIVLAEIDSLFMIDKNRTVATDTTI